MTRSYTLYIVDDDPLLLQSLEAIFLFAGFQVKTYINAQGFLESVVADPLSCLLLDLQMPQISGLEVQQRLMARGLDMPIIIYTGNADVASAVKAMTDGAYTLIQKPVANDVLIKMVCAAIDKGQKKRAAEQLWRDASTKLALLSERERDIAVLAADGLSAMAIAEKLFISVRTVEAHKASIFIKLGIKSVTTLTRLVTLARMGQSFNS